MLQYFIPTTETYVESVARAIARRRLHKDAADSVRDALGDDINVTEALEDEFDDIFERIWAGNTEDDIKQKNGYREDAIAAIGAINLKLIIGE